MADPFVHLHVASGYSMRYGATQPKALVERAAELEMDTIALTDRDGAYGAVRFAQACQQTGVRPVLGVDLAMAPTGVLPGAPRGGGERRRSPMRGGSYRDPGLPRVTFLAGSRQGWAAVCRLVSATHLAGERGEPVCTLDLVAEHAAGQDVVVLLGPASELGVAVAARRLDHGRAVLRPWRELFDPADLLVEVVHHRLPGHRPGSAGHAAQLARLAQEARLGSVLSNAVRYADRADAVVVDVLDAVRRLVPLDRRHVERYNAEGFMKSGKEMADIAAEVCAGAGLGPRAARDLVARTRVVADRCALDPRTDLGLGEVHFPELEVTTGGVAVQGQDGRTASADEVLRARCEAGIGRRYGNAPRQRIWKRLDDELRLIADLGYASYFLTVADVCDMIREKGIRSAARGSGAGSVVTYLLGVSGVDPLRHGLLMERFLSPLRRALPDIDIDVESARREEIYEDILDRYGGERCIAVSMMDTYRVRHAIRDVGAALGMPPGEIDAIAKAFPHIRARDVRMALRELPELRASGLDEGRLGVLVALVERLDGLPRHIALHPCGIVLSDATLLDRTPVEASYAGFPMSQFDKEDVEDLGLLKLDVLGIRMQSAMAHAVAEIERVDGKRIDLDDEVQVPFDDTHTFEMISDSRTLGCFQIESPGQRELVGKSGIESFGDIVTDISLFRPGPVKSDMITPYLEAKQGWRMPTYLHGDLRAILGETRGVVVYHEQVMEMIALFTGCTLAEADEARRALGSPEGMAEVRAWFLPTAKRRGYPPHTVEEIWRVIGSFGSFGFCKAHAAAFALPTYQSAWLKAHYPAHFLAGVLTHDPGMYPKRLILDDARHCGVTILGLDVNASAQDYTVERLEDGPGGAPRYGIRVALADVTGISDTEVGRVLAARPYHSLTDFWHRAGVSRPVAERLVLAGGFDTIYGVGEPGTIHRRGVVTRRDLLLQIADLDRYTRAVHRAGRATGQRRRGGQRSAAVGRGEEQPLARRDAVWGRARAQAQTPAPPEAVSSVQLALDLGDGPADALHTGEVSGLPEMDATDRVHAELEILGLDASRHVMDFHTSFLDALGAVKARHLLDQRSKAELLVAGVKVATQSPPIRSGRRVVFLTLDDGTGPVDATFFEDALGPYATTVFHSWLLVVRGELRRTGRRGVSLRATGCWELPMLHETWRSQGMAAVEDLMGPAPADPAGARADRPGSRRVFVHSTGFALSPYADIKPPGESAPRKIWHSSPGSSGW